jgi:hypothetical protein
MVQSAIAILNLSTGVPEIYVGSVEILIAHCQIVGIPLLAAEFLDPKVPQNGTANFYSNSLFKH